MHRNILVPVEDTDTSVEVLDWVIREMYKDGDEIHLIHVIPVPMPEVVAGGFGAMDTVVTLDPDPKEDLKHIADAKEMMRRRFTPTLASQSIPFQVEIIHFPTDTQSIGEAVVARAGNLTSCIIAMAKHNRGKVSTFIFGSTSRYVVDHAPCPTVIVTNQSQ
jgi:structural maintenance of chromosome 2|mmetsp:Transcript_3269/g.9627  ORF Transcript_3269/g.9627 Transcript_3269/m.9627 type:complete len:162 (+) Transcript_3269:24-509(+)